MSAEWRICWVMSFYDDEGNKLSSGYGFTAEYNLYDKNDDLIFEREASHVVSKPNRYYSDYLSEYVSEMDEIDQFKSVIRINPFGGYSSLVQEDYIKKEDFYYRDDYNLYQKNIFVDYYFKESPDVLYKYEDMLGGLTLEQEDLTRLADEGNIDVVITSLDGSGAKVRGMAQENSMSFGSNQMRIAGTDFVEHIKNDNERIELSLILGDVWVEDGLDTHRQKELGKLIDMYKNNDLLSVESNLTHDIYGLYKGDVSIKTTVDGEPPRLPRVGHKDETRGAKRLQRPSNIIYEPVKSVAKLNNVMIEEMDIEQTSASANTYNCSLSLKKVNFVESDTFLRYPTELRDTSIEDGEVDRTHLVLTEEEDEGDNDEEDEEYRESYEYAKYNIGP